MGAGLACRAGCAGSWAQREPFSPGKAIRCKAAGPKQGRQPRAQHGTEQPQKVVVGGEALAGHSLGDSVHLPGKDRCPYFFLSQAAITLFPCAHPCLAFLWV